MYNGKFPSWETATNTGNSKYDGQFAYVHAKRGQVLLCERWAEMFPRVKVVSCHPGKRGRTLFLLLLLCCCCCCCFAVPCIYTLAHLFTN
jgi:hypothetical protein